MVAAGSCKNLVLLVYLKKVGYLDVRNRNMSENLVPRTLVGNSVVSLRSEGKGKKGPNAYCCVILEESSLSNRAAVEQAFNCLLISVHQIYQSSYQKKLPQIHIYLL